MSAVGRAVCRHIHDDDDNDRNGDDNCAAVPAVGRAVCHCHDAANMIICCRRKGCPSPRRGDAAAMHPAAPIANQESLTVNLLEIPYGPGNSTL